MPDRRTHRGAHPEDARDFALDHEPVLSRAVEELSYLLTHGYAETAALKLVGDRHQLTVRQRSAVSRGACSDAARAKRWARRADLTDLVDAPLAIDGFNCLISIEALLSGAPLFIGRDGALRDLASVHGTYRHVEETEAALGLLIETLEQARIARAHIYLDRPVGNSGRLRALIEERCRRRGFESEITLTDRVDQELVALGITVASSDGWILERAPWLDLPAAIMMRQGLSPWCLTLCEKPSKPSRKADA